MQNAFASKATGSENKKLDEQIQFTHKSGSWKTIIAME
jgi:hypothetical protein